MFDAHAFSLLPHFRVEPSIRLGAGAVFEKRCRYSEAQCTAHAFEAACHQGGCATAVSHVRNAKCDWGESIGHGSKSTPKFRMTRAKTVKHKMVMPTPASMEGQKPIRGKSAGNARNMGSVGTTYQNVYQA